ncbi:MAG: flagellar hook-length control protein FliK [Lachnospiraceae bacterium]|nr:flagellar hook-length control protein FliK [Lachnospiraceae bacterium]
MTSAPVNGVGSLLNFVGSRAAQTANAGMAAGGFGDVMSKASGNGDGFGSADKVDYSKDVQQSKMNSSYPSKEISKAESVKETKVTEKAVENPDEAMNEAGKELVKEVADKLGVSEEEVVDAMEELGFGMAAILDADNLTQLVLTLSGEESSLAFLTNEGLYGTMQELLQSLDTIQTDLAAALNLTQEELTQLIEENATKNQMSDIQTDESKSILLEENAGEEPETKITVTVEQGEDSITLKTDEKGNVIQVEGVNQREDGQTGQQTGQEKGKQENLQEEVTTGNPILDNLLQNKVQNPEVSFEQATLHMTPDTNEIMDQILDYMKIQLKPGMDQLTMQLHPESLGSLHIQITSKGGEVTAQFRVQDETVKAAIESQVAELKETLKNQGIKVEAVEVTVESHAFESNLWQGQGREENASYQGERKGHRRINLNELEGLEELTEEEDKLAAEMMEANGNTVDYTA